jgi:uncharacterized protein (DUF2267 family)
MKYDELIKHVRERTGTERAEAERITHAVVQALADRLTGDEARHMLSQLPEPLKSSITVTEHAEALTATKFVERIATELGCPPEEARARVHAVLATLEEALTPGELHDVLVQLPSGYMRLVA